MIPLKRVFSPKFIGALIIDLVLITLTILIVDKLFNNIIIAFIVPVLVVYAVLHMAFEALGIG